MLNQLQQREVFHIAFLRQFVRSVKPNTYALKGGSNLRLFYNSIRYSEDMDLDIKEIEAYKLKDIVMEILGSKTLAITLRPFQIDGVVPPDIKGAKQTETVQRFKVHLKTSAGEDLFTKIEFSKRNLDQRLKLEAVSANILYKYKQPPLIVCHYPIDVAIEQKIRALADRSKPQARDIFDIFMLHTQLSKIDLDKIKKAIPGRQLKSAEESLLALDYEIFRNTVCNYLSEKDRTYYERREIWDEIQLKVHEMISI